MFGLSVLTGSVQARLEPLGSAKQKKTGMVEHPLVFDHAGLLANEPPGKAGLLFIKSSDIISKECRSDVAALSSSPSIRVLLSYSEHK
jgi:hypothetical protein